jgi:hypothetical protein
MTASGHLTSTGVKVICDLSGVFPPSNLTQFLFSDGGVQVPHCSQGFQRSFPVAVIVQPCSGLLELRDPLAVTARRRSTAPILLVRAAVVGPELETGPFCDQTVDLLLRRLKSLLGSYQRILNVLRT